MKRTILIAALIVFGTGVLFSQPKIGINLGDKAPELIGQSFTGETYKLSNTKGQLVLLDFWAAWCGPCRRENPTVVGAYKKYKDKNFENGKGFTIFSVSLDRTEDAWKKGVEADKLEWPYHISDLKYWQSKHGAIYGVRTIPANFLINGDGIIIARDLRGPALAEALEKLTK